MPRCTPSTACRSRPTRSSCSWPTRRSTACGCPTSPTGCCSAAAVAPAWSTGSASSGSWHRGAPAPPDGVRLRRGGCPRLVDRLVELGYVTRCAASTDGRGLYAHLTEAGVAKAQAARATHLAGVREYFLNRLTITDQIALRDIWD